MQIRRKTKIEKLFSKEEFEKLYNDNDQSAFKISKITGFDFGAVRKQLSLYGIKKYDPGPKYEFLTKEILEEDYKTLSIINIARKYKLRSWKVNLVMRQFEIPIQIMAYNVNEQFFETDTPESLYVVGFIAADGNLYRDKRKKEISKLTIELKESDKEHLERIKNLLQFTGPITTIHKTHNKIKNPAYNDTVNVRMEISSKKICKDLERFGLTERKSLTYKMPEWLVNHELVNCFLLGYFDGDGSIYPGKKNQWFMNIRGTIDFLTQFDFILRREKIIKDKDRPIKLSSNCGRVGYACNPTVTAIYSFLLGESKLYLARKHDRYIKALERLNYTDRKRLDRKMKVMIQCS